MNAALRFPVLALTRAQVIGIRYRISKTYGGSPFAARIALAYERAVGCNDSIAAKIVSECRGMYPLSNASGKPCSLSWYDRKAMTWRDKLEAERLARVMRGEQLSRFTQRQAS
jgi:hypothetical protein